MTPSPPFHRYKRLPPPGPQERERLDSRGERGRYDPDDDVVIAVNTALAARQPLLVAGEPGTGKSCLAWSVAEVLGLPVPEVFVVRSDSLARDALYHYDAVARLRDAQLRDPKAASAEPYIRLEALGKAIAASQDGLERVVLFDEIDKAPRDFPNDLLHELDRMEFTVRETGRSYAGTDASRPLVVVTSNSERPLPEPFLRRCVFVEIQPPGRDRLERILRIRMGLPVPGDGAPSGGSGGGAAEGASAPSAAPTSDGDALVATVVDTFVALRSGQAWEKAPSTSELLAWVRVLVASPLSASEVAERIEARRWRELFPGALAKTRVDLKLLLGQR